MKDLQKKSLNFILENLQEGKLDKTFEYEDYFDVINALLKVERFSEAREILLYLSKFQKWSGNFEFEPLQDDLGKYNSLFYLNSLGKYLLKINDLGELKFFKRILKKCISSLRDYFDEDYLLFFRLDSRNRKVFFLKDNIYFLSICSEFSDFLNHHDFTKLADELFMLKGKVELGFERYFFQKDIVIQYFFPEKEEFLGLHEYQIRELYNEFSFKHSISDKILKKEKKEKEFPEHFLPRLQYYLYLKKSNKEYKKYLKKDLKFLLEIPTTFVPNDFTGEMEKSLFHKDVTIIKTKGKSDNLLIKDIFRLRVASLILQLLN